ncbi:hypothetical protein HAP94_16645 [Acidithiobacillus ferrivorans]|nr:hypothetical protein [Acidithiobacillus ferrivorans]
MKTKSRNTVGWEETLEVVKEIVKRHEDEPDKKGCQIILVGGSSMLAHHIRASSGDVDIYSPDLDADIIMDLESEYKRKFGNEDFRIDATPTENLWGNLLVRDIAARSPLLERIVTHTSTWDIKALDVETLFLVKLEAGRKKDFEDLIQISSKTNVENLSDRFKEMVKWHGLPDTIMGYADRFIDQTHKLYGASPNAILERIAPSLPKRVTSMLRESWDYHQPEPCVLDQERTLARSKNVHPDSTTQWMGTVLSVADDKKTVIMRSNDKNTRLQLADPNARFPSIPSGTYGTIAVDRKTGTVSFSAQEPKVGRGKDIT